MVNRRILHRSFVFGNTRVAESEVGNKEQQDEQAEQSTHEVAEKGPSAQLLISLVFRKSSKQLLKFLAVLVVNIQVQQRIDFEPFLVFEIFDHLFVLHYEWTGRQ